MIFTFDDLRSKYKDYTDIKGKIRREAQHGRLVQIARGIYEDNKNADGKYLAGIICGPSYLSFDFALSYYGLIPEAVYYTYTSATFDKRKIKQFKNKFGVFTYRDVPNIVFNLGVNIVQENGYSYQIATPEKAICDKLYTMTSVHSIKEMKELLFEDLRIDEHLFWNINFDDLLQLAKLYNSTNLKFLIKLIEKVNRRK